MADPLPQRLPRRGGHDEHCVLCGVTQGCSKGHDTEMVAASRPRPSIAGMVVAATPVASSHDVIATEGDTRPVVIRCGKRGAAKPASAAPTRSAKARITA